MILYNAIITLFSFFVSATPFFFLLLRTYCEKVLYILQIALKYCLIERILCGYVGCLDGHNSVNIDAINLKF